MCYNLFFTDDFFVNLMERDLEKARAMVSAIDTDNLEMLKVFLFQMFFV